MSTALPAKQNLRSGMALVQASGAGDFDSVVAFISAGVDVNSATDHGMTALMSAAAGGHHRLVNHLLAGGADINAKRFDGLDALALAVFFGHPEVVRELLGAGADPNAKTRFGTSLAAWATARGFSDIAQILTGAKTSEEQTAKIDESNQVATKFNDVQVLRSANISVDEGVGYNNSYLKKNVSRITIPTHNDSAHDYRRTNSVDSAELTAESRYPAWNSNNETHQERKLIAWLTHMTSDWLRLTLLGVAVMLASTLATFAILRLLTRNKHAVTPAIVSQPATSDLQRLNAPKTNLNTTTPGEEISPTRELEDTSAEQSSTSGDAERTGKAAAVSSADPVENPNKLRPGKNSLKQSAEVADRPPKQSTPLKRDNPVISNPVLRLESASPPAKKILPESTGPIVGESVVRTPPAGPPKSVSIEVQRPRRAATEEVPPVPAVAPAKSRKTKVIQWP